MNTIPAVIRDTATVTSFKRLYMEPTETMWTSPSIEPLQGDQ